MKIEKGSLYSSIHFHAWYLDDGAVAGQGVLCRILNLLQEGGPALGTVINLPKVFSQDGLDMLPLGRKE